MRLAGPALLVLWLCFPFIASAQASEGTYSRRNSFSGFVEYSNDSSHILLGLAENRKIGAVGIQYQRRLVHGRAVELSYMAEFRPAILESDPTAIQSGTFTVPSPSTYTQPPYAVIACHPATFFFKGQGYSDTEVITCSRRTVFAQGLSPAGLRINAMTGHRLQPTFSVLGGYMFSPQAIPTDAPSTPAGSFNFSFEFGAGFEFYRTGTRSMRLEYQVQHYSNKDTASANPGVDSGFVKLTYAFGR